MNVIQVCPMFPYHGGVERYVLEISKNLQKRGINVEVYTTDPTGELPKFEDVEGILIHRFRSFAPNNVYFFAPKLYFALKELKNIDIIHAHTFQAYPSLAASLAKKGNKAHFVFTPHYHPVGGTLLRTVLQKMYRIVGNAIFDRADMIVAVSQYERNMLSHTFKVNHKKIVYIPNGVDVDKFKSLNRRCKNSNEISLLYVGRLEKYKGIQHLIYAFARIFKEDSQSKLLIVGSGPYRDNLRTLVNQRGLKDKVEFLENVPESKLLQLYASSDVFIMPSEYEAFCISLVEAMASGIAVIATKVGGIPEIIQDGYNGFLIDFPPHSERLSRVITRVMRNEDLACKAGCNARKTVSERFTLNQTVHGLLEIYNNLVKAS